MERVGHHLQSQAIATSNGDRDVFARSAFNRYYYAMFLMTRSMLGVISGQPVTSLGHKSYPDHLRSGIAKRFKDEIRKASKMSDPELEASLKKAVSALLSLASQMEKANTIRVVADYQPDVAVEFDPTIRFKLADTTITDAHNWVNNTKQYIKVIQNAWSQVNV